MHIMKKGGFSMSGRILYSVPYFDGIQVVTRCAASTMSPDLYIVFDRYDDGEEYLITRGFRDHVRSTWCLEEVVSMLEEVQR